MAHGRKDLRQVACRGLSRGQLRRAARSLLARHGLQLRQWHSDALVSTLPSLPPLCFLLVSPPPALQCVQLSLAQIDVRSALCLCSLNPRHGRLHQDVFPVLRVQHRQTVLIPVVLVRRRPIPLSIRSPQLSPAQGTVPIAQVRPRKRKRVADEPRPAAHQSDTLRIRILILVRIQFTDPGVTSPGSAVRSVPIRSPPPAPRWSSPKGRKFGSSRPTT